MRKTKDYRKISSRQLETTSSYNAFPDIIYGKAMADDSTLMIVKRDSISEFDVLAFKVI